MDNTTIAKVIQILRREVRRWKTPAVGIAAERAADRPFGTLVSTVLSLRTKDAVTDGASQRLLGRAPSPAIMASLTPSQIEKLIYPVGFYRTKARNLLAICAILLREHGGKVPRAMDQLLSLPGVGRKTANLVITIGYGDYGICVDTHVHRISNRWGYVNTRTPDETEFALRQKLPKKYWKSYNDLLVTFGQNLCVPISPWCSKCPVARYCEKMGVVRCR
jgi:endonuclease-3